MRLRNRHKRACDSEGESEKEGEIKRQHGWRYGRGMVTLWHCLEFRRGKCRWERHLVGKSATRIRSLQ